MIADNLENLYKYNIVPKEVLDFINSLDENTPEGKYNISEGIYANIESYVCKKEADARLEAHKKYIDVQLLITGTEKIAYTNTEGLEPSEDYDSDRDIIFYHNPQAPLSSIYLNGRNFAIFFPQDAHAPQIAVLDVPNKVKKCVVKIAVNVL